MNKLFVVLIISTVIMGGISGLLFYQLNVVQNENSILMNELENQNNELQSLICKYSNVVKITDFSIISEDRFPGYLFQNFVNVTITNFGINDVENLILTIKSNTTEGKSQSYSLNGRSIDGIAHSYSLDFIGSGEKIVTKCSLIFVMADRGMVTVTLELGDKIIDEYTTIPI